MGFLWVGGGGRGARCGGVGAAAPAPRLQVGWGGCVDRGLSGIARGRRSRRARRSRPTTRFTCQGGGAPPPHLQFGWVGCVHTGFTWDWEGASVAARSEIAPYHPVY